MTSSGFKFDNTYLHLPEIFYTNLVPAPVPEPEMVILNTPLAIELGLDFSEISLGKQAVLFAGNQMPESAEPFAQAYAGHQFGGWVPQLGDGRAGLLSLCPGKNGPFTPLRIPQVQSGERQEPSALHLSVHRAVTAQPLHDHLGLRRLLSKYAQTERDTHIPASPQPA